MYIFMFSYINISVNIFIISSFSKSGRFFKTKLVMYKGGSYKSVAWYVVISWILITV